MASTSALYNNGDSLGKVDWTRERETFLHLLFARYELFTHDKDALEEIFQRAYPEFKRCNRDATALYDRWQPRWADGRKGLNWRVIDRTDSRNTYNTNPYTQQELDDFKTLDAVILLWSAHIAKTIQPVAGAGPDLTHAVANPSGILNSLTTTPGHRHAALLPGEALPAPMRLYLESHPATGGAPIYDFTLRNTIGVDAFPVFGPKKVKKRSKAKQSSKKTTNKAASASKKRARDDSDADESGDDDDYEPTAHQSKRRRIIQPRKTKHVKQQSSVHHSEDEYEADVSDGDQDASVHGDAPSSSKQPSVSEHMAEQNQEPNQPADVSDEDEDTTVHGPATATSEQPSVSEHIAEHIGEPAHPTDDEPYQLPMAHYSSLIFGKTEVFFEPGSTIANSVDLGPESEAFKFGGYVHIITIDEDAPPELQASGQQFALMTVCNTKICQKCKGEDSEDSALPEHHSWDIVHREDLLEEDDGTLVFVGRDDGKLPKYTTELPMSTVERDVAFAYDETTGPNRKAVYKVLVCEDPDEVGYD